MKKGKMVTICAAIVFVFACSVGVFAATKPKSIEIVGKSTVYVGQEIDLDTRISPAKAKVRDSKIRWSSSKPSVAKVMDKADDDTDIKGVKAGTAVITVKIQGTKIKDTHKVTVKKKSTSSTSTSSDEKKLDGYKKDAKNLIKKIKKIKVASSASKREDQYYGWKNKIENLEDKLDRIEDKWEDKYDDGKISYSTYRKIEKKVDSVENYLDQAEEYLDEKFDWEFDD